jgi:uncharacterized metal-binding protein YceD (DUF177 family)
LTAEERGLDAAPGKVPPEMPRPFPLSRIGAGAELQVEATPEERVALARRMKILSIQTLTCRFDLHPLGSGTVQAQGLLRARVTQTCVVTLEPFEAELREDFAVRFVPAGTEREEIDFDDDDEIGYAGNVLDLGEAASEQLALALDPFPRRPGAELAQAHREQQEGAFAALTRLLPAPRPEHDTSDD